MMSISVYMYVKSSSCTSKYIQFLIVNQTSIKLEEKSILNKSLMYSNIFYNSNRYQWQCIDYFLLMGMMVVYYTIFLMLFYKFSCRFEIFYCKKEDRAENCQFSITHLSGVNSFSDSAIYSLNNHSSPNFQLSLKFFTFSIPINVQLLVLLQR